MGSTQNDPWLTWAAIVVPGFATALTWPLTAGLPLVNRMAEAVAAGVVVFAVVYLAAKGRERNGR
jgi:hypothetical protein